MLSELETFVLDTLHLDIHLIFCLILSFWISANCLFSHWLKSKCPGFWLAVRRYQMKIKLIFRLTKYRYEGIRPLWNQVKILRDFDFVGFKKKSWNYYIAILLLLFIFGCSTWSDISQYVRLWFIIVKWTEHRETVRLWFIIVKLTEHREIVRLWFIIVKLTEHREIVRLWFISYINRT